MMDSKHEDGTNKLEAKHDDAALKRGGKKKSLSSASSLSSSSSSATSSTASINALEFNSGEEDPLDESYNKSDIPHSPLSEGASPLDVSGNTPQWSMVSASPRTGTGDSFSRELPPTPDWTSPMKSPSTQTMGRGYDPNRIPSSVFATRPTTPMEWSVASNESLFSIHMGNNSFSKDHILMMGDNKQEDWSNSPPVHMHNTSDTKSDYTTNLSTVLETPSENDKKSTDKREESGVEQESGAEQEFQKSPKKNPGETVEASKVEKLAPGAQEPQLSNTTSTLSQDGTRGLVSAPRVSEESANSRDSFAFPVLETNEGQKNGSLKAIEEKSEETKPQDPQPPPPAPKEAQTSWFSCLQCLPRCC